MSVKGIFKTLLGTVALIGVISLIIEMVNVNTTSLQLNQISKIACRQSAVLFSQESYKQRDMGSIAGGSVNMDDVKAADGSTYVSGNFYGNGLTPREIYDSLYTTTEFENWADYYEGNWKSVDLIRNSFRLMGREIKFPVFNAATMTNEQYDKLLDEYTDKMLAVAYNEVMMTPLNMGVPYLDKNVMTKMFRWNLAQLASDCNSNAIQKDSSGNNCIFYKGFRVYADEATITNIEYRVYNLDETQTKPATVKNNWLSRMEFKNVTHLDPDNLDFDSDRAKLAEEDEGLERSRICVVGISFNIPVGYEGITPIKDICNFFWTTEVEGLKGTGGSGLTGEAWNDSKADLSLGGFNGKSLPDGALPVPGKLIYYIVR